LVLFAFELVQRHRARVVVPAAVR